VLDEARKTGNEEAECAMLVYVQKLEEKVKALEAQLIDTEGALAKVYDENVATVTKLEEEIASYHKELDAAKESVQKAEASEREAMFQVDKDVAALEAALAKAHEEHEAEIADLKESFDTKLEAVTEAATPRLPLLFRLC